MQPSTAASRTRREIPPAHLLERKASPVIAAARVFTAQRAAWQARTYANLDAVASSRRPWLSSPPVLHTGAHAAEEDPLAALVGIVEYPGLASPVDHGVSRLGVRLQVE